MAARLGNVLCWLGGIIDAVVVLSVVALVVADNTYTPEHRAYAIMLAVVLGAIPLGIGRALRYILAGT
jgi:membrane-associated PAP2 superfamily phosphatase